MTARSGADGAAAGAVPGRRTLVVSPYPPRRDGIGAYAVQQVRALLRAGEHVEVLSPGPSAAHHHLDLLDRRGPLALARRARHHDRTVVHFHPDVFFPVPGTAADRVRVAAGLAAVLRLAPRSEVVVHEVDYRWGAGRGPVAQAVRRMWQQADVVRVHSRTEADAFVDAFGVDPARVVIEPHGATFRLATRHDRASARASLGVPADVHLAVCLGFVQPHKGFDRAVRAAAGLDPARARLVVAGSVRTDHAQFLGHADELAAAAERVPAAEVRLGYLSDEMFDRWLVAADTCVLPYREIWTSGVLERAALAGCGLLVTDVGGLAEQARATGAPVDVVQDDDGLARALRRGGQPGEPPAGAAARRRPWDLGDGSGEGTDATDAGAGLGAAAGLGASLQEQVRRRAHGDRSAATGAPQGRRAGRARRAGTAAARGPASASAPLRRLPPFHPPAPTSARPGASLLKQALVRLTDWRYRPLVHQVNALQAATTQAVEEAAAVRVADLGDDPRDDGSAQGHQRSL